VEKTAPATLETPPVVVPLDASAEKTELDPAHLKKADKAPENAKFLAAHDSVASKAKGRKKGASPTPPGEAASPFPKPTPLGAVAATPTPGPSFRTALPRPTPLSMPEAKPPAPEKEEVAASLAIGSGEEGDEDGIDAIGAWKKAVANPIGVRWNFYRESKLDLLAVGSVRIKFAIDAKGHASEVRVLSNTANPTNALYAVRSIMEAEIPPIPPERLARLPGGRVEVEFTFTIFPSQ